MELELKNVNMGQAIFLLRMLGCSPAQIGDALNIPSFGMDPVLSSVDASRECLIDLLKCKMSKNAPKSEAELFGVREQDVEDAKRRTLDPTTPVCDVCGTANEEMKGGVVIEEDDETFTVVCQSCYDTFTRMPPKYKVADTWFKRIALSAEIGTDASRVYEWLDRDMPFEDNVRDFMVRQKNRKAFFSRETCTYVKEAPDGKYRDYCTWCMKLFGSERMIACSSCKQTRYCSERCQKKDRRRHRKGCVAYGRSLETQRPYILPDPCEGCQKFADLKSCGRCLEPLYCSTQCQKKMWNTHKMRCKSRVVK